MDPDAIDEYVDAVIAEVVPYLRAAVDTWARLGVVVPEPQELAQTMLDLVRPGIGGP